MLHGLLSLMDGYGTFLISIAVLVFTGTHAARHYRDGQKAGLQTLVFR